jgi:hypothetical protein
VPLSVKKRSIQKCLEDVEAALIHGTAIVLVVITPLILDLPFNLLLVFLQVVPEVDLDAATA